MKTAMAAPPSSRPRKIADVGAADLAGLDLHDDAAACVFARPESG